MRYDLRYDKGIRPYLIEDVYKQGIDLYSIRHTEYSTLASSFIFDNPEEAQEYITDVYIPSLVSDYKKLGWTIPKEFPFIVCRECIDRYTGQATGVFFPLNNT